jgi:hypothetical protein
MQNKPNLLNTQMNVSKVLTRFYENIGLCRSAENKPNSNPIKAKTNPIQTQFKPNLSRRSWIKPNFETKARNRLGPELS